MSIGSTESDILATAGVGHSLLLLQQYGGAAEDEGRRVLLEENLLIGRDNPLFAVRYPNLSRRHAALEIEGEAVRVVDLQSRHGTFVQGQRVERGLLTPGDLLEVGGVGFLLIQAPADFVPPLHPRLAFASYDFAVVLRDAVSARGSRRPVVVVGEHGVGKNEIAHELMSDAGPALLVDRLDEANEDEQRALLAALRLAENDAEAPRVIVLSREAPEVLGEVGRLLPSLLSSYLDTWVIHVSPLRTRAEDIVPIVHRHLSTLAPGAPWSVHPKLLRRLLLRSWVGNVRALLAEVERLQLAAPERELVDSEGAVSSRRERRRIGADGSWIEDESGQRIKLGGRRVLRGVLRALIEAHLRGDELLTPNAVAELTWPGEAMLPRAALNRVYVAMTSLRKLGLDGVLEHVSGGYRLVEGSVEIVP